MVPTEFKNPTTSPAASIAGGFIPVRVDRLFHAWRACHVRPLGIADFRAWLGCHEMHARRCSVAGDRSPSYDVAELARLLGITPQRARASLRRIVAAGLVSFALDRIDFPEVPELGETLDVIGQGRGDVVIPRRMLRLLATGAKPALIATSFGILLRCLSRRRAGFDGRGRLKASWVAQVFEVDVRRVKAARAELVSLGWIRSEPGNQWALNRWGRVYRIDLSWDRPGRPALPLPAAKSAPCLPPPESDLDPLREKIQHQEPVQPTLPTGVQIQRHRDQDKPLPAPKLDDIRAEDLRETGRLLDLHRQAVERQLIGTSEADRLKFVALAEHARSIGRANPPGLFAALLRRGAWSFITQAEEDAARRKLRAHLWAPVASLVPRPVSRGSQRAVVSEDTRIAREISRSLQAAGYRGDPFPQMRRLDPTWTRARWDAALQSGPLLIQSGRSPHHS